MVLLIDNYDSFVFNLARYVSELGLEPLVRRHDAVTVEEIEEELRPTHIIISPGPCTPAEAGISTEVVRHFGPRGVPVLGVCLGHQCIGEAYGGEVVRAARPMHGKVSAVYHDGTSVFAGLPSPLRATRYHSLVVRPETLPASLRAIAHTRTPDGRPDEVMGLVHREHPVVGVQFHPESALTEHGYAMLDRFLRGDGARPTELPDRADMVFAGPNAERGR